MRHMHRQLRDLRNVGRAILADLHLLGIETVARLAREKPSRLFRRLERTTGQRHDPCVLDVFVDLICVTDKVTRVLS
jgi:nucleotidyltransferase/DNA polymerase involved in DNA repair